MKTSFQAGVDSIYNAIVAQGTTPASKSLSDVTTGISTMSTNRYNAGVSATKKGTATAAQVLTGYTFTNSSSVGASGTMTNNGAVSKTFTPSTSEQSYTVPSGYHNGSGVVKCSAVSATKTLGSTNGTAVDMGGAYRYVNTNAVYNAGVSATKKGTATAAQVLTGYTFTNSSSVGASGTMTNNGTQSTWNPSSSTSKTYAAGYYPSSWTVNSSNAYSAGQSSKISGLTLTHVYSKSDLECSSYTISGITSGSYYLLFLVQGGSQKYGDPYFDSATTATTIYKDTSGNPIILYKIKAGASTIKIYSNSSYGFDHFMIVKIS